MRIETDRSLAVAARYRFLSHVLVIVTVLCRTVLFAADGTDKKADKPATKRTVVTIPKDAVKNPNGTYSYTDKDGRKWTYTNSPFGVMKTSSGDTDSHLVPADSGAAVKVIDKGDTVRFERPSPFGTMSWEKKKSDLTEEERKMVDAQKKAAPDKPDEK